MVKGADDFDSSSNFTGSLKFAKALVAGRYDFRKVLVEGEGADFLDELRLGGGVDGSS